MKHRLFSFAAVSFAAVFSALVMVSHPASAQTCATVEVQNVRPDQGMLMVAAYADAAGFNKAPVAALQMRPGATTTMTFPLCGLSGGSVALTLFQDLNGNGKLDANAFGIPSEPWGASGKQLPMSAPTWETSAVPLDGTTVVVKLSK
ncbi:MAG: DUF2141 domain-containing protein [Caldimonas sp.]